MSNAVMKNKCSHCYCPPSFTALYFPGGLDSVEYYDIASNEWRAASPMPWRGVTVKCAAVGDIIYVLAGFQGVGRLGHVLEYHTDTDRCVYIFNSIYIKQLSRHC